MDKDDHLKNELHFKDDQLSSDPQILDDVKSPDSAFGESIDEDFTADAHFDTKEDYVDMAQDEESYADKISLDISEGEDDKIAMKSPIVDPAVFESENFKVKDVEEVQLRPEYLRSNIFFSRPNAKDVNSVSNVKEEGIKLPSSVNPINDLKIDGKSHFNKISHNRTNHVSNHVEESVKTVNANCVNDVCKLDEIKINTDTNIAETKLSDSIIELDKIVSKDDSVIQLSDSEMDQSVEYLETNGNSTNLEIYETQNIANVNEVHKEPINQLKSNETGKPSIEIIEEKCSSKSLNAESSLEPNDKVENSLINEVFNRLKNTNEDISDKLKSSKQEMNDAASLIPSDSSINDVMVATCNVGSDCISTGVSTIAANSQGISDYISSSPISKIMEFEVNESKESAICELSEEEEDEVVVTGSMKFDLSAPNIVASTESVAKAVSPVPNGKSTDTSVNSDISKAPEENVPESCEVKTERSNTETFINAISSSPTKDGGNSSDRLDLPSTVERLRAENGADVFIVGTAHFSKESQEDVAKTIRIIQPDIVMVELCKARTTVLQLDEETLLRESKDLDFAKVRMIVKEHGAIQGVLYLLLLSVSSHITKELGMAPGGEFRAAFKEARRAVPWCVIQLGDRPIHITLGRALASLSVWQKAKLAWHILTTKEPISKEEVEKCKQRDFIEEMLAEMTGQFPAISEVFVRERDIYLTWSLQSAAESESGAPTINDNNQRSRMHIHTAACKKLGSCATRVVGVVGIGHVPGILERWGTVTDDDIEPIMIIPPPTLSSRILKGSFKFGLYGTAGFIIYKLIPSSTKSLIRSIVSSSFENIAKRLIK